MKLRRTSVVLLLTALVAQIVVLGVFAQEPVVINGILARVNTDIITIGQYERTKSDLEGELKQGPHAFPTTLWLRKRDGNRFKGDMREDFSALYGAAIHGRLKKSGWPKRKSSAAAGNTAIGSISERPTLCRAANTRSPPLGPVCVGTAVGVLAELIAHSPLLKRY